ncbi:MAG TPA: hypothetical protein VE521_06660 [Nitrososphaera sp.]|jgi:hypothetical protein|nr:hypothetical protein [Nitrososphaera sp.]
MFNIRKRASLDEKEMWYDRDRRRDKQSNTDNEFYSQDKISFDAFSKDLVRNNDVDEGVIAFGTWLSNLEGQTQSAVPISIKSFEQDRLMVLRDNILQKEVIIDIVEGVPSCRECRLKDCIHVGFAICAEQMHIRLDMSKH